MAAPKLPLDLESPEMQRAYDIHGAFYGDSDIIIEVTVEDQKFYDEYVGGLYLLSLDNPDFPFGVRLWLCYAVKYISHQWKEANLHDD